MSVRNIVATVSCLIVAAGWGAHSPNGRVEFTSAMEADRVVFSVSYDGEAVAKLHAVIGTNSPAAIMFDTRVYDEGFAFRYRLPNGGAFEELTMVEYPDGTRAWAIPTTEATYPKAPLPIARGSREWMTPLTTEGRVFAAFFDAYAVGYPRIRLTPAHNRVTVKLLQKGAVMLAKGGVTPWRVLQVAKTAAELVDHSELVRKLNPPSAIADTSWIHPGLTISNLSNCRLRTDDLIAAAKAEHEMTGAKYLQLDWGWYGTEWRWTDEDLAKCLKHNPELSNDVSWVENAKADPKTTARGTVPYLPHWQRKFQVEFEPEFNRLIPELAKLGMGLCLYVRGVTIEREESLDALFGLYEQWGVQGIKPGFVRYGSADDTDWNRRVVECAARHHLWVDVHDADIPDGMDATYPNLFLKEGVGGEEGKHPVHQDLVIPFARGLVGPFDYCPMVFKADRSHTHVLAMLLCYPGKTSVLRGSSLTRTRLKDSDSSWGWSAGENEWVKALPFEYDESRTLDAVIAHKLVVARRAGETWYLAGMSAEADEQASLDLGFLKPNTAYWLELWQDDAADNAAVCRRAVYSKRRVTAASRLEVTMCAKGGLLAKLTPMCAADPAAEPYCRVRVEGETVEVASNAMEVMMLLNGKYYGSQVPDEGGHCHWSQVPFVRGINRLEFRAGQLTIIETVKR